jgi:hypothetical protein
MWIIPKPLHTSLFAPDMAALISDSDELSELYEQSLMWRSKPSPSRTWSRRLSKDSWILALSTQTLKPCRGSSIVEKWTSSQVASLASHLALQGDEQEMKIHDTSGRTSSEASNDWADLPLFSSRTSREYSEASSTESIGATPQERLFCSISIARWNAWVMKQRQDYSARVKSARPTNASACSYSVFDLISNQQVAELSQTCSDGQEMMLWPTPTVQEIPHPDAKINSKGRRVSRDGTNTHSLNLVDTINLTLPSEDERSLPLSHRASQSPSKASTWRTPTARDWKGSASNYNDLPKDVTMQEITEKADMSRVKEGWLNLQLNPRWVETLMGLPIGWVCPSSLGVVSVVQTRSGCSATESSLPQPSEPLESSLDDLVAWPTPTATRVNDSSKVACRLRQHSTSLCALIATCSAS